MAEKETTVTVEKEPVAQNKQNLISERERRRQSREDRQKNRVELAKRPGTTVFAPEMPDVSFEMIHNIRQIDRAMSKLSRNIFQAGGGFEKIEKAGKKIENMQKELETTAQELAALSGEQYREFNRR